MRFKYICYRSILAILSLAATQVAYANCDANLTVTLVQDLDFGDYEGTNGGTITIATDGVRTATGGVVLLGGSPAAATYEISTSSTRRRCRRRWITITVPASTAISGPASMTVNNFVTSAANNRFRLGGDRRETVTIGADLVTNNNQSAGFYNGNFSVDFSY